MFLFPFLFPFPSFHCCLELMQRYKKYLMSQTLQSFFLRKNALFLLLRKVLASAYLFKENPFAPLHLCTFAPLHICSQTASGCGQPAATARRGVFYTHMMQIKKK